MAARYWNQHFTEMAKEMSPKIATDPEANKEREITALSIPRWTWSRAECRTWLAVFLTRQYEIRDYPAERLAKSFNGIGPNLYLMTVQEWKSFLGYELSDPMGIFAYLLKYRKEELPEGFEIVNGTLMSTKVAEQLPTDQHVKRDAHWNNGV